MAKCKVLKGFPYSHDGNDTVWADEGSVIDVREELISGLTDSGNVEALPALDAPPVPEVVEQPVAALPDAHPQDETVTDEPVEAAPPPVATEEPSPDQRGRGGKKK